MLLLWYTPPRKGIPMAFAAWIRQRQIEIRDDDDLLILLLWWSVIKGE